jgi:HEAT repeat protein
VLADLGDRTAVAALEAGLTQDDSHLRGNIAFVLGRLGDQRGFETLAAILADRSARSDGQGIPGGRWSLKGQIRPIGTMRRCCLDI